MKWKYVFTARIDVIQNTTWVARADGPHCQRDEKVGCADGFFFSEIFTRYNGNMMGKMNENDD